MLWVSMVELVSIIGDGPARKLSRMYGGVRVYVPTTAHPEHALGVLLGMPGFTALCRAFGGESIFPPNGKKPDPHKDKVLKLLGEGKGPRDAALACGVTERYARRLAQLVEHTREGPRQLSLL